jgi:hypothetical protein
VDSLDASKCHATEVKGCEPLGTEYSYVRTGTHGIIPATLPIFTILPFDAISRGANSLHIIMTLKRLVAKRDWISGRVASRAGTVCAADMRTRISRLTGCFNGTAKRTLST